MVVINMLQAFFWSCFILSFSACNTESLVSSFCNGLKVEQGRGLFSECYIQKNVWKQENIPFNEMINYLLRRDE